MALPSVCCCCRAWLCIPHHLPAAQTASEQLRKMLTATPSCHQWKLSISLVRFRRSFISIIPHWHHPIINAPKSKPVLPSTAQTRSNTGLKICTCIVITLVGDQKVFSQPSHYWNFLYQGFYPLQPKLLAA